jgi:hypothetical protein
MRGSPIDPSQFGTADTIVQRTGEVELPLGGTATVDIEMVALSLVRTASRIEYRPDGKPESPDGQSVSAAHAGSLTLAVTGQDPVGCDLEPVQPRRVEVWRDLLGPERFQLAEVAAQAAGENLNTAATRIWCAVECVKKAGGAPDAPIILSRTTQDKGVLLQSGSWKIVTWVESVQGFGRPLGIGVLWAESKSASRKRVCNAPAAAAS